MFEQIRRDWINDIFLKMSVENVVLVVVVLLVGERGKGGGGGI